MQRTKIGLLTAAALGLLVAQFFDGSFAAVAFSLLAVAFPVALMALPPTPAGSWRLALGLTLLLLLGSVALVWLLAAAGDPLPSRWGLPPAAWVALIGIWLGPLLLLSLGHGLARPARGKAR